MPREIINEGLKELCAERRITLKRLAEDCGVNRGSIFMYLRGRPAPRLEKRMASVLGIRTSVLKRKLQTNIKNKGGVCHEE